MDGYWGSYNYEQLQLPYEKSLDDSQCSGKPHNIFDCTVSIKEEELMNISRESLKDTQEIDFQIDQLLKNKDSDSEAFRSNQDILQEQTNKKVNVRSLFEHWIRENTILGENFILIWLDKNENAKTPYELAKNNLHDIQK